MIDQNNESVKRIHYERGFYATIGDCPIPFEIRGQEGVDIVTFSKPAGLSDADIKALKLFVGEYCAWGPPGLISKVAPTIAQLQGQIVTSQPTWDDGNPDFVYTEEQGVYDMALRYLNSGFSPMPINRSGVPGGEANKYPPCSHWQQWRHRTISRNEMHQYWVEQHYGIGAACGPMSGGLEVLDFESAKYWFLWSEIVQAEHPSLFARLVINQTPRGGRHLPYRYQRVLGTKRDPSQPLARELVEDKVVLHIETRGEGSLVLLPGCPADCHPLNKPYLMVQGTPETIPMLSLEEVEYMRGTARQFNLYHGREPAASSHGADYQEDPDAPWTDYDHRTTFQEILEPHGWTLLKGDWECGTLSRPGKGDGPSATTGVHGLPILHVFTSSSIFEPESNYTKSACYAMLNHEGNFSEAAHALIAMGYGRAGKIAAERKATYELYQNWENNSWTHLEQEDAEPMEAPYRPTSVVPEHGTVISSSDPYNAAKAMLTQLWFYREVSTLHYHGQRWWLWVGDSYNDQSEEYVRKLIWDWMAKAKETVKDGKEFRDVACKPNSSKINNVLDALKGLVYLDNVNMPRYLGGGKFPAPQFVIPMLNGLLDVRAYFLGKPNCLMPHTPLWLSTNVLPYEFVPGETCPQWLRFMEDVMGGDMEAVEFLRMWMGYNLIPDQRQQCVVFLPGSGGNGKGVFLQVMQNVIGEYNICTPTFSSMSERFGRCEFVGKLSALMGDAHMGHDADAIKVLEFIKSVSGGDAINIEPKGKDTMTAVRLNTRFTLCVNEMPRLPDSSRAIGRRVRIVPFHQNYTGREDRKLPDKLAQETSGIFLWALEGLKKILAGATLVQPECGKDRHAEFVEDASPISAFVDEYCDVSQDYKELKENIRIVLNAWLMQCGHNSLADNSISRKLCALNSRIASTRLRIEGGSRLHFFTGIRLNEHGKKWLLTLAR